MVQHDVHYVERGDPGAGTGVWAIIAVLIILFALLFFGANLFGNRGQDRQDVNIRGDIEVPGTPGIIQ